MSRMTQAAPYPHALADLVGRLHYKRWDVTLADLDRGQGSAGLTLVITREGPDTWHLSVSRELTVVGAFIRYNVRKVSPHLLKQAGDVDDLIAQDRHDQRYMLRKDPPESGSRGTGLPATWNASYSR